VDLLQSVGLGAASAAAAVLGSMLGLGGGVFLVPIFTLFFGVSAKTAIAASAVAVVTNSVVGSQMHLRNGFTNLRLSMVLQITTAIGALVGAFASVYAPERLLYAIFGLVLVYASISMVARRTASYDTSNDPDPHTLGDDYYDQSMKTHVSYVPHGVTKGLGVSGGAGIISGMLGVGGGVIQVPAMNLIMRIPLKAAAGTSAFMVGITAVSTAFVHYSAGNVDPTVVVPAMIGIFAGGRLGSVLTKRMKVASLLFIFVAILLFLGASMFLTGVGVDLPWQRR
jgi:uncharacterized membrane protein YfcA